MCLVVCCASAVADETDVPELGSKIQWKNTENTTDPLMAKLAKNMPRLEYRRGERWPLLVWGNAPQSMAVLQGLIDRGISPLFNDSASMPRLKATILPQLQLLKKNEMPIVILPQGHTQRLFLPNRKGIPGMSLPNNSHEPPAKPASASGDFACPAWLYENPGLDGQARALTANLSFLKASGIDLAGLLLDFETGAYLRNGAEDEPRVRAAMEQAQQCSRCVKHFGTDAMQTPEQYAKIVEAGRAYAVEQTVSKPAKAIFPHLYMGNFFAYPTNRLPAEPGKYPAYGYEGAGLNILQPRYYVTAGWGGFGKDQRKTSWYCIQHYLAAFSPIAQQRHDDEMLIPWIGHVHSRNNIKETRGDTYPPPSMYAELVRHMFLRGTETFALFIASKLSGDFPDDFTVPDKEVGPWLMLTRGVQQGYDDMLRFDGFVRKARPLTFAVPSDTKTFGDETCLWSGVATQTVALVRTVTYATHAARKPVDVFGHHVVLPFTQAGAFYWVFPDGSYRTVDGQTTAR